MGLKRAGLPMLALLAGWQPTAWAAGPEFSWMTLNGITAVTVAVEGVTPDVESYGVKPEQLQSRIEQRLAALGIKVVPLDDARTLAGAGQLKLRLVGNRSPHGPFFYGVKLNLRQKIPLGNPAGGFVSQLVWSDGESGMMQFTEGFRVRDALDHLLDNLAQDYHLQNGSPTPSKPDAD